MLPFFKRNETWAGTPDTTYRGDSGALGVVPSPFNDPLFDAWIKAGKEASYAFTSDYNGAEQENFLAARSLRSKMVVAAVLPTLS